MPRNLIASPRSILTARRKTIDGNILVNGNFEVYPSGTSPTTNYRVWINGTGGGDGSHAADIYGWATGALTGTASAMFDNTQAYEGSHSMKLSVGAASSQSIVFNQAFYDSLDQTKQYAYKIQPGDYYDYFTLSYRMKTNLISGGANTGARAGVQLWSGAGVVSGNTYNPITVATSTDWTYYSFEFQINNFSTRFIQVILNIKGNDGASTLIMDAWFDDVRLVPNRSRKRPML